jgi:hypothetical protein
MVLDKGNCEDFRASLTLRFPICLLPRPRLPPPRSHRGPGIWPRRRPWARAAKPSPHAPARFRLAISGSLPPWRPKADRSYAQRTTRPFSVVTQSRWRSTLTSGSPCGASRLTILGCLCQALAWRFRGHHRVRRTRGPAPGAQALLRERPRLRPPPCLSRPLSLAAVSALSGALPWATRRARPGGRRLRCIPPRPAASVGGQRKGASREGVEGR